MSSWDDIYASGKQLNLWPFSEVVSAFARRLSLRAERLGAAPRVLEVGCGTGNNLWFLAEAGFSATGVDSSPTAVAFAKRRLSQLEHQLDVRVAEMTSLPFEDESFDYVLDRAALTHNARDGVRDICNEARQCLRPGGEMLSFGLFGMQHPDRRFGAEISKGVSSDFSDGIFAKIGLTSFWDEDSIRAAFAAFQTVRITRTRSDAMGAILDEHYSVVARR